MASEITVRSLIVQIKQRGAKAAADALALVATRSDEARKSFGHLADAFVSDAARMAAAAREVVGAVRGVGQARAPRPAAGGRGGRRGGAGGPDPLDAAIRRANVSEASRAGMVAGATAINDASSALGRFASASDRAKAKVADLSSQVERNRKEMVDLKRKTIETGDADGTLAARMKGLSVATLDTGNKLAVARRELRGLEGGLIAAIKGAHGFRGAIGAVSVAVGTLAADVARRGFRMVTGAIAGSAEAAIDFNKIIDADLGKLLKGADDTAEGMARIKQGIKDSSAALGVMPDQVAQLTTALAPVFSGKVEADTGVAADLVALTADVTKIGKAWDITGGEAGQFFADASRGLELTSTQTKALFGSINELGNELGVKSKDVAEGLTRAAGVFKGSGLSGETGSAIVASLIATGNSAEVAATGARTFVRTLEVGRAATPKQSAAFRALGLDAKEVGANMSKGGKQAEAQILAVVQALHDLPAEDKLPTLIELFGSESIGSVGAVTTSVEALGKAFQIAGSETANFASVEKEYARVSQTTAARIEALKAQVGVLAIEFGEALLPHIDRVVQFLTSPEGKEWGRNAVEGAANAISTLASVLGAAASGIGAVAETIGGAETAILGLGIALAAMVGPLGLVTAAGAAAGLVLGKMAADAEAAWRNSTRFIDGIASRRGEIEAQVAKQGYEEMLAEADAKDAAKAAAKAARAEDFDSTMAAFRGAGSATGNRATDEARFAELSGRVKGRQRLKPSEMKELRGLSKALDKPMPLKGAKPRTHKMTKQDRALAAIDPDLAGVLRQGGEEDAGGDLKVHDDPLSKAAYKAATGSGAGGSSLGAGPSISNTYNYFTLDMPVTVDARGNEGAEAGVERAAGRLPGDTRRAVLTGLEKVVAGQFVGGRL